MTTDIKSALGSLVAKLNNINATVDYLKSRAMMGDLRTTEAHASSLADMVRQAAELADQMAGLAGGARRETKRAA
ncbi:MAG TPA: hypothetical protein VEI97_14475 [bacterium]|nr:hypothetical protein [bacterium]